MITCVFKQLYFISLNVMNASFAYGKYEYICIDSRFIHLQKYCLFALNGFIGDCFYSESQKCLVSNLFKATPFLHVITFYSLIDS